MRLRAQATKKIVTNQNGVGDGITYGLEFGAIQFNCPLLGNQVGLGSRGRKEDTEHLNLGVSSTEMEFHESWKTK